jgi:NAD-dependent SIR2 family protein deacetylase
MIAFCQCTECGAAFEGDGEPLCPACRKPFRRRHPLTVQCRSCGADVVWFRTAKGNRMPVDESSTLPTDAAHQLDLKRHISHFATCPHAAQHRRVR